MEIAVMTEREIFVKAVTTNSPYDDQHTEAVKFCLKTGFGFTRGLNSARAVNPDVWPLVSLGSLQRIMRSFKTEFEHDPDFHLSQRKKKDARSTLTNKEREDLAACMREAALSGNGFSRAERVTAVIDILKWRRVKQAGGGRAYVKLSVAANRVLSKRKVGRSYWRAFYRDFPMLEIQKVKETSAQRAKQCSRKVAEKHIAAIKACLIKLGIYDEATDSIVPGKEGNIIWMDECGNFFNYNLRRGSSRNITGVKGKLARTALNENRGTFTIDAALGGDGYMYHPHLIFAQDSLSSDMLPPNVSDYEHMLISNNDCGVQTGFSFLPRYPHNDPHHVLIVLVIVLIILAMLSSLNLN